MFCQLSYRKMSFGRDLNPQPAVQSKYPWPAPPAWWLLPHTQLRVPGNVRREQSRRRARRQSASRGERIRQGLL